MLDRLEALGYGVPPQDGMAAPTIVCQEPIELLPDVLGVRLPAGARFDPGGIGKGLAADLVVEHLVALGATTVQVELGGDVRLVGENWTGGPWHVRIQSPVDRTQTIGHADVASGAIATSAVAGNRWQVAGREVHHLIDPFTGEPSSTDVVAATAISSELWWAEIVAKVVVLRGSDAAASVFTELGAAGSIVRSDGTFVVVREQDSEGIDIVSSQVWWFVSRSSGIIAWALVSLSVAWGLFISTKAVAKASSPAWLLDLHRYLGGLSVAFTAVHLIGLWADSYVEFGWAEMFVPLSTEWKPWPVAFGIVALYLLVAVEATSLMMCHLPRRWWRAIHHLSLPLYVMATYHGIVGGHRSRQHGVPARRAGVGERDRVPRRRADPRQPPVGYRDDQGRRAAPRAAPAAR